MSPPLTAKKVFEEARRGDRKARRACPARARIALAIVAVASVVDPELVILGGGIGSNGDLLLDPVGRELRELSPFPPAWKSPPCSRKRRSTARCRWRCTRRRTSFRTRRGFPRDPEEGTRS